MKPRNKRKTLVLAIRNGFSYIALWQFAGFVLLLLLVWANEVIDIAALLYHEAPVPPNVVRGCMASAGVIVAAIVVVGNTYLQQRNIISGLLTVCSYCRKIRIEDDVWHRIEDHLTQNPMLQLTHGMCPECYEKVKQSWEESGHAPPRGSSLPPEGAQEAGRVGTA